MNVSLFIARRYFFSGRKKAFINVISIISMGAIAFFTSCLIIVLSVFNGLEDLLISLNASFDPQLKIEAIKRKTFEVDAQMLSNLKSIEGVSLVSEVIEDYAYVRYLDLDMPVIIRGISDNFTEQKRLDDHMVTGMLALHRDSIPFAIVGEGVKRNLKINVNDDMHALQVFYIRNVSGASLDPSRMYARKSIRPGGVFSIEKNYDENYIFLPLDFTRELLNYGNRRTWLEVKVNQDASIESVKHRISEKLGENFKVLTNEEQHADLYRLLKIEKLVATVALATLILIGSINVFFSLMMLAIDKQKDVSVLFAMGAETGLIKKIFISEGAIIAFTGATIGIVLGALTCFLQDQFGLVGMGMENAIVTDYPVKMKVADLALTAGLVIVLTFLTSFYPAAKASRSYNIRHL